MPSAAEVLSLRPLCPRSAAVIQGINRKSSRKRSLGQVLFLFHGLANVSFFFIRRALPSREGL